MDLLKTVFTNHAYSIFVLLCTIVAVYDANGADQPGSFYLEMRWDV